MKTYNERKLLGELRTALKDNDPTLGVSTYLVGTLVEPKCDRNYPKRAKTLVMDHPWLREVVNYEYRVWAPREDWVRHAEGLGLPKDEITSILLGLEGA